jgi:hypothetical protein
VQCLLAPFWQGAENSFSTACYYWDLILLAMVDAIFVCGTISCFLADTLVASSCLSLSFTRACS